MATPIQESSEIAISIFNRIQGYLSDSWYSSEIRNGIILVLDVTGAVIEKMPYDDYQTFGGQF